MSWPWRAAAHPRCGEESKCDVLSIANMHAVASCAQDKQDTRTRSKEKQERSEHCGRRRCRESMFASVDVSFVDLASSFGSGIYGRGGEPESWETKAIPRSLVRRGNSTA